MHHSFVQHNNSNGGGNNGVGKLKQTTITQHQLGAASLSTPLRQHLLSPQHQAQQTSTVLFLNF